MGPDEDALEDSCRWWLGEEVGRRRRLVARVGFGVKVWRRG